MNNYSYVIITQPKSEGVHIHLSPDIDDAIELVRGHNDIVYIRSFSQPFDAVAHKHLLDFLSEETINDLIKKNKINTHLYLDRINMLL